MPSGTAVPGRDLEAHDAVEAVALWRDVAGAVGRDTRHGELRQYLAGDTLDASHGGHVAATRPDRGQHGGAFRRRKQSARPRGLPSHLDGAVPR
jgi:hypothetical protein